MDAEAKSIMQLQWEASQRGALSLWTVYDHPRDYPGGFIARRFEVTRGSATATHDIITSTDLSTLRDRFLRAGLVAMDRSEQDEPQMQRHRRIG